MNLNDYQFACRRTWNVTVSPREQLINATLGISGESGEWAEDVKKHLFHGAPLPDIDELGDILYYVAVTAWVMKVDLSDVAERNVAKLRARYPDGFDPKRSRNRDA